MECNPFLEEPEEDEEYRYYCSYKNLRFTLNYTHQEALQTIGISEEKFRELLLKYAEPHSPNS